MSALECSHNGACSQLQIQHSKDVIVEFIKNDDFKYLRLLGALCLPAAHALCCTVGTCCAC